MEKDGICCLEMEWRWRWNMCGVTGSLLLLEKAELQNQILFPDI